VSECEKCCQKRSKVTALLLLSCVCVCVCVSECEVDKRKSLLPLVRVSDSSVYQ
jgi:hypothetical protein